MITSTPELLAMTSSDSQVSADSISSCFTSFVAVFFLTQTKVFTVLHR